MGWIPVQTILPLMVLKVVLKEDPAGTSQNEEKVYSKIDFNPC